MGFLPWTISGPITVLYAKHNLLREICPPLLALRPEKTTPQLLLGLVLEVMANPLLCKHFLEGLGIGCLQRQWGVEKISSSFAHSPVSASQENLSISFPSEVVRVNSE